MEKTFRDHLIQHPAHLGAHQKFQHMTDCISHCLLSTYRCRCQPSVLFHPHGTELFPNAQTDLPLAALRCSCQVSAEPSIPLLPFLRELQGAVRSSLGLQFPRLGHPNASASPHGRCLPALRLAMLPPLGPSKDLNILFVLWLPVFYQDEDKHSLAYWIPYSYNK